MGIGVTVIGTLLAVFFPMDDITGFLYFIGSVFAPMTAILIADVFILKKNKEQGKFNIKNTLIWLVGFILYRYLMTVDIIVGNTLPTMVAVILICIALKNVAEKKKL